MKLFISLFFIVVVGIFFVVLIYPSDLQQEKSTVLDNRNFHVSLQGFETASSLTQELAELRDDTQLFFPKDQDLARDVLRRIGDLHFDETSNEPASKDDLLLSDSLVFYDDNQLDSFYDDNITFRNYKEEHFFQHLLERESATPELDRYRSFYVRVIQLSGKGKLIHNEYMTKAFEYELDSVWDTMECMVFIDSFGVLGSPLIIDSSGDEIVDKGIIQFVINGLSDKLSPGYYRVFVGS
tara:strand:+ start:2274 stop:2990 length:717 start_codon:yes stop_codon:yes gene_type:complete